MTLSPELRRDLIDRCFTYDRSLDRDLLGRIVDEVAGTLTAAPINGTGSAGRVHSLARSTVTSPWWLTSSPASSARMTSTHSRRRASRSGFAGHPVPVMCSLLASPLPRAAQKRPGYMAASVPIACAMIAGW